jgi:D-3-phosphoglycerate dehydrogenase / 2-oxoglutarate reductase
MKSIMKATVFSPLHPTGRSILESQCEVVYFGWAVHEPVTTPLPSDDEIISTSQEAEIIITPGELSAYVMENCPKLKLVGVGRGDPRGVDLKAATRLGIKVVYSAGRNAGAVAEVTLGFIIMLLRKLIPSQKFVEEKHWKTWDDLFATPLISAIEMQGKTLGLIGFGLIGKEVSLRALPFGMHVLVYDPYIDLQESSTYGVQRVSLDEVLSLADIVSIHCKLTDETRGLIGTRELDLMKSTAYLINTARASVVDRQALLDALRTRRIAGVALDVYWEEPLKLDDELIGMENVIHTPHIAGATSEMELRTTEILLRQVQAVLDGNKPEFLANPEVIQGN